MTETLERLGVQVVDSRGDEIQCYCPVHVKNKGREDRTPSFWINAVTGANLCFSCGHRASLYTLVEMIQDVGYEDAKKWLGSGEVNLSNKLKKITKQEETFEEVTYITESMLSAFSTPPVEALKARGLTAAAAAKHQLLWDVRHSNWITVIRDPLSNKLLGWQEKGHNSRYFKNQPAGVHKSSTLFGYNNYKNGDMILVESPLDVVRLDSVGISGGVAAYGSAVSMAQFNLIRGASRIILALDNDESGTESTKKLLDLANQMGVECWVFNYSQTDMKDIGGMSRSEIEWGLQNAIHMLKVRS